MWHIWVQLPIRPFEFVVVVLSSGLSFLYRYDSGCAAKLGATGDSFAPSFCLVLRVHTLHVLHSYIILLTLSLMFLLVDMCLLTPIPSQTEGSLVVLEQKLQEPLGPPPSMFTWPPLASSKTAEVCLLPTGW